jgi:hypothetical protein
MSWLEPRRTRRQSFSATCEGVPGRKSDLSHSGERARRAVPLRPPRRMGHLQTQVNDRPSAKRGGIQRPAGWPAAEASRQARHISSGRDPSAELRASSELQLGVECEEGAKFAHIAQILEGMHTLDDCFCPVSAEYWRHQVPRLRV